MRIADRNARLKVCSLKDFIDKDPQYKFYRKGIYEGWGNIKPKAPSRYASNGYVIDETGNKTSHIITMKYRHDIEITNAAWIYHERLKSAPTWYRIVSVLEDGEHWKFYCRLFEKSDDALKPLEKTPQSISPIPLSNDVKL